MDKFMYALVRKNSYIAELVGSKGRIEQIHGLMNNPNLKIIPVNNTSKGSIHCEETKTTVKTISVHTENQLYHIPINGFSNGLPLELGKIVNHKMFQKEKVNLL